MGSRHQVLFSLEALIQSTALCFTHLLFLLETQVLTMPESRLSLSRPLAVLLSTCLTYTQRMGLSNAVHSLESVSCQGQVLPPCSVCFASVSHLELQKIIKSLFKNIILWCSVPFSLPPTKTLQFIPFQSVPMVLHWMGTETRAAVSLSRMPFSPSSLCGEVVFTVQGL